MLTVVGYNSDLAVQAVTTSDGILLTFIGFPALFSILTIVIMLFHTLDKKKYEQIVKELDQEETVG